MLGNIKGDIVDTVRQVQLNHPGSIVVLAHGCNCMNNMGAGLAKSISNNWPTADRADKSTKKGDISKLGNYTLASAGEKLVIANIYSQYKYGGGINIDYKALEDGLTNMVAEVSRQGMDIVYLVPEYIGCGLAGGDIDIVSPMLTKIFKDTNYYLFGI